MIRNFNELKQLGIRGVLNRLYFSITALGIMYKDYDMSDKAANYAKKTVIYSKYDRHRINATDVYNILAYLSNISESDLSKKDLILVKRASLDVSFYTRYLRLMMNGSLSVLELDMFIRRITKELYIEDSILKSLGRMSINWNRIGLRDRKLTSEKLYRYGVLKFRRSDMIRHINDLNNNIDIDEDKYRDTLVKGEGNKLVDFIKGLDKLDAAIYGVGGYAMHKYLQKKREAHSRLKSNL